MLGRYLKKMKLLLNSILIVLTLLIIPSKSNAQSTSFEPAEGYFSSYHFLHEYHSKIRNILLEGVTQTPDAMLITLSSFGSESATVLTKNEVLTLSCSEPIWNHKNPEKIKIVKKSFRISNELSNAIHLLWFDALVTTSYSNESRGGLDGTSYYFTSFKKGLGLRAATAWTPKEGSLPEELIEIAVELDKLNLSMTTEKKLLTKVKALNSKLKKKDNKSQ